MGEGLTEDNWALLRLEKNWQYQKASPVLCIHPLLLWGKTLWFESISEITTPLESANLPCSYCTLHCISSGEGDVFFLQTVGDNCSTEDARKRGCYNSTGSPGTEVLSPSSMQELLSVGDTAFPHQSFELYFWWEQVRGVYNSLNDYLTLLWNVEQALFVMSSIL